MPNEFDNKPESIPSDQLDATTSESPAESPSSSPFEDVGTDETGDAAADDPIRSEVDEMFADAQSGFEEQSVLQDGGRVDKSLPVDQHHPFPQSLHEQLEDRGYSKQQLDVVVDIDSNFHRGIIHGNVSGPGGDWNAQVETFLGENPAATKAEIDAKVNQLAASHDLDMSNAHQYNDWLTGASIGQGTDVKPAEPTLQQTNESPAQVVQQEKPDA